MSASREQLSRPESLELAARACFEDWKKDMAAFAGVQSATWEDERDAFIQTARVAITVWCEAEGIAVQGATAKLVCPATLSGPGAATQHCRLPDGHDGLHDFHV